MDVHRCFTELNTTQVCEELGVVSSDLISNPKLKDIKWMETGAFGPNSFEVLFSFRKKGELFSSTKIFCIYLHNFFFL